MWTGFVVLSKHKILLRIFPFEVKICFIDHYLYPIYLYFLLLSRKYIVNFITLILYLQILLCVFFKQLMSYIVNFSCVILLFLFSRSMGDTTIRCNSERAYELILRFQVQSQVK